MARIRSIHPGLFTDEAFMTASPHARLLVIGLWCEAFDDGCFEVKPLTLKARLFPADNVDMVALLAELEALGYFKRFFAGEKVWGALRNFCRYQRPKKPNSSRALPDDLRQFVSIDATGTELDAPQGGVCSEPTQDQQLLVENSKPHSQSSSVPVRNQTCTGSEKSPQMEEGGGRREEATLRSASAAAATSAASPTDLQRELGKLVGQEPVLLAQDHHTIQDLLDEGLTWADVVAGIGEALAKADRQKRFSHWRQFVGWIRTAAKNRMGQGARSAVAAPKTPSDPNDPTHDMGTGYKHRESTLRSDVAKWRENPATWRRQFLGEPPDNPNCRLPKHLMPDPAPA